MWKELWRLIGTTLRCNIAFHSQTQGIMELINLVIGQPIHCTIHEMNEFKNWVDILSIVNSIPNRSTGYPPFFLNYEFHLTMPVDLTKGNGSIQ